mmetsp:Transcript_51584/g.131275  ORF Transcript_51584/g.131275 Transcript_51584/m.131275 type:complete len:386 (-) Transcript_51584:33-1190(-)
MVALPEQSLGSSVPPDWIRIRGDFAGTVTTATHYLEVTLPLDYQVPIAAIEPAVAAFMKSESAAFDGHSRLESRQELAKVWHDIRAMLTDSPHDMDVNFGGGSNLADVSAKDALISELLAKLDSLKAENSELKHQVVAVAESFESSHAQEDMGEIAAKANCPEHHCCKLGGQTYIDPTQVGDASVWLNGSFSGIAQTQKHFLDIALPIKGLIPAARALELFDGLADLAEGDETFGQIGTANTWGQLSELLTDVAPRRVASEHSASGQELHALKEQLANAIEDKRQLESEMANVQLQLESLRSTKSVEVGDGAMDAQSVVQLHSTLRQFSLPAMGVSPLRARHRTTPRPGSVLRMPSRDDVGPGVPDAYAASVANLQTLTRWAVCQ